MVYEFAVYQSSLDGESFWVAESKVLNGCASQGDTAEEAIKELEINEKEWIEEAVSSGKTLPPKRIRELKIYNGKIALRTSPLVHKEAVALSDDLGISLNQYINDALISYNEHVKHAGTELVPTSSAMDSSANASITLQQYNQYNQYNVENLIYVSKEAHKNA